MVRSGLLSQRDLWLVAAAASLAAVVGALVVAAPLLGVLAVASIAVALGAVRVGPVAYAVVALMLLPWFVIMEGVAPPLIGTLIAASAAGALLVAMMPLGFPNTVVPVAAAGFVLIVGANWIFVTGDEQFNQGAKYLVFVAAALATSSVGAAELLPRLRAPLLASGFAAIAVHLGIVAAGVGNSSSYYGVGERLGLAADGPHALALLTTIMAGAALTVRRTWLQIALFSPAVIALMLTGVRSALLGLALMVLLYLWVAPSRARAAGVLVALLGLAIVSGAADVVVSRFDREASEFASFAAAGSGRGLIWTVALEGWAGAGPVAWVFGAGLQAVAGFQVAALGSSLLGHSDLVEVLVNLGVVGFVSWAALWLGLLRAGMSPLILLPVGAFALVNGSLQYVAALTFGLCLASACLDRRSSSSDDAQAERDGEPSPRRSVAAL